MKGLFRASVFLGAFLFLIACGPAFQVTPTPVSSPLATSTLTALPSPTRTTALEAMATSAYVMPTRPTSIPTIDPTQVPELLGKAFSIQTRAGANDHKVRQITGWEYGFGGGGMWHDTCPGYDWLDTSHLLLYPATGQVDAELPSGVWSTRDNVNVVPQPVTINLETGQVWLPPEQAPTSPQDCNRAYWSRELGVMISPGRVSPIFGPEKDAVLTHTFDGQDVSFYWGKLLSVSPSGTKILVDDDTIIDLRDGKITELDWYMNYDNERDPYFYWTSDERRLYRCCYYYADTSTGNSYRFELSDLRQSNGSPGPEDILLHGYGSWVRNDTCFLVEWSYMDDGDIRYLPMFDPVKKNYYDVRAMAGISEDWTAFRTDASWDGKYIWLMGGEGSYLVDLFTFESRYYPDLSYVDTEWSLNSQFVWLHLDEGINQTHRYSEYSILSIADNKIRPFPVKPIDDYTYWWHAREDILIYPSEDNALILLDVSTMSFRELSFRGNSLVWSPSGEKLAFVAEDGSVWQVDYPKLENPEQLTSPLPHVHSVGWSPDGSSIAFISGSEIYIVDTMK